MFATKFINCCRITRRVFLDSTLLSMDEFYIDLSTGPQLWRDSVVSNYTFQVKNGLTQFKHCEEIPSMAKKSGYPGLRKTKELLCRDPIALSVLQNFLDGLTYEVLKKRADQQLNNEPPMLDV